MPTDLKSLYLRLVKVTTISREEFAKLYLLNGLDATIRLVEETENTPPWI